MATIKTQIVNGVARILTKTTGGIRRVSCSCCAQEGCCMYPANGYNIFFFENDLPDELILNLYVDTNLLGTYTAIKNATANGIYWWDLGGGDSRAIRHEGEQWGIYAAEFPNEQPPSTNLGGQICLIDDPELNILPVFEDNFEEFYAIEFDYAAEDQSISETVTVTRTGLCEWSGQDQCGNPVLLYYTSIDSSAEGQPIRLAKWEINFTTNTLRGELCEGYDGFVINKDGANNGPAGVYGNPPSSEESEGGATVTLVS